MNSNTTHIVVIVMILLALAHSVLDGMTIPTNTTPEMVGAYLLHSRMYSVMSWVSCLLAIITNMRTIEVFRVHQIATYNVLWSCFVHAKLEQISVTFAVWFSIIAVIILAVSFVITDIMETTFSRQVLNTPILDNARQLFRFRRGDHPYTGIDTSVSHVHEEKEVSEDKKPPIDS